MRRGGAGTPTAPPGTDDRWTQISTFKHTSCNVHYVIIWTSVGNVGDKALTDTDAAAAFHTKSPPKKKKKAFLRVKLNEAFPSEPVENREGKNFASLQNQLHGSPRTLPLRALRDEKKQGERKTTKKQQKTKTSDTLW